MPVARKKIDEALDFLHKLWTNPNAQVPSALSSNLTDGTTGRSALDSYKNAKDATEATRQLEAVRDALLTSILRQP